MGKDVFFYLETHKAKNEKLFLYIIYTISLYIKCDFTLYHIWEKT